MGLTPGRRWTDPRHGMMATGRSSASAIERPDGPGGGSISDDHAQPPALAPDADDRAIVEAVLGGDREAFRRLVERESAAVVRACQRILVDHAEAEDVAQEAFVTAYRSLASWRGDGPFGAWLGRIAVRLALRQATRRRALPWLEPAASAADRAALAAAPATDPALLSVRDERSAELHAAVIGLPEPYREVVALRFFADATLDDIARQTGRPLGTIKTQLHRGLARLRTAIEPGGTR
jgi:RNA polymerase sigma-70 factor (ECF subfamily)